MNVLVTGGAGYIGSHTCVELLNRGMGVVCIDNLANSSVKAMERVEQITGKHIDFYKNDVRDRAALDRIFEKHDIDCVIHFAGLKAVGESVAMPLEYYDNNLFSTVTLCETMRDHGVKNIVFSSSATVYSGDNEMPLRETSRTGMCTNPYGWTKYMSEQIMRDTAKSDSDWSIALLRYFNPIGAHPSGMIGEDPRGIPNNLMPYISQVAVGRRDHLSVFGDDYDTHDGTGVRDYIHVVDPSPMSAALHEYPLELVDVFLLNELEGADLCGESQPEKILQALCRRFPQAAIVLTLGKLGVRYFAPELSAPLQHGIYKVKVADTTAAGDTFTGYFLASLVKGLPVTEALHIASLASSIAVSRYGAAPSIPYWDEVIESRLEPETL